MSAADERLAQAKKKAASLTTDPRRKWLTVEQKAYGGDSYLTRLHILEGTPPRAYIVENEERGICTVIDINGDLFGQSLYGEMEPVRWVPHAKKRKSI